MKKVNLSLVISSVRSRKDGSLGLSIETPELKPEEKTLFMELQGINLNGTFEPMDEPDVPEYKINADLESKTPSQRLRGALFVWWDQTGKQGEFETFYKQKMETLIEFVKRKLD